MLRLGSKQSARLFAVSLMAQYASCSTAPEEPAHNKFSSRLSRPTVRQQVYGGTAATPPEGAAPRTEKEERLVEMWRDKPNTGRMKPAPAGEEPNTDVDVAQEFGATFRDQRPIDPNESMEDKRRRLVYQSRYRGMVEMDLIFGHFARCKLAALDAVLLDEYDMLLKQLDNDLFNWLVMGQQAPQDIASLKCFAEVRKFVDSERKELLGHY